MVEVSCEHPAGTADSGRAPDETEAGVSEL